MPDTVDELAATIIAAARKKAGAFLDDHEDAKEFLAERAKRMAELVFKLTLAKDDDERTALKSEMEAIQLSIETEALNVALDADEGSRSFFKDVLGIIFGFAKDALPIVIKALV